MPRQNQLRRYSDEESQVPSGASGSVSPEPPSTTTPQEECPDIVGEPNPVSPDHTSSVSRFPAGPLVIEYCPDCTFPRDYCEFGGKWDVCKTRAMASEYAECYAHYLKITGASATSDGTLSQGTLETSAVSEGQVKSSSEPKSQQSSGSKKKQVAVVVPVVSIQRVSRAKHKTATVLTGLDKFGVKLDAAAKIFKKQFACGASMVKGLPGQYDVVEIQGDFEEEVIGVLRQNFPEIPETSIVRLKAK